MMPKESANSGGATPLGTQQYAEKFPSYRFQPLGTTSLLVSQAGFGSYRIAPQIQTHHLALQHALAQGINLIDTSSNYADGGSERLIGHVLELMLAGGQISREQIVIVSKVGYLQGENYTLSQQRKALGEPFPELVEYSDTLEHCIHPVFIQDQLTRTLSRLKLQKLDVYLLHNPEYYLGSAEKQGIPVKLARERYYDRIARAFAHLESEVEAGRIGYYGISSNTFVDAATNPQFTNLSHCVEIARLIKRKHHFRVIQFPMNLLETGAVTERNQPDGGTVISIAKKQQLGVLVNRPLNAVVGSVLIRLADAPATKTATIPDVEESLAMVVQLETQFQQQIMPALKHSPQVVSQLGQYLTVGQMLQGRWFSLGTYHQWQQTVQDVLIPRLNAARSFLVQPGNLSAEDRKWLEQYVNAVNLAFSRIGGVYGGLAMERTQELKRLILTANSAWSGETLSQSAIRALRSTSGISSVLVGMREVRYVDDVLAELRQPVEQSNSLKAWEQMST
jgi:aryl-alcohol dehydrogenase-like predicted oxidoreductase